MWLVQCGVAWGVAWKVNMMGEGKRSEGEGKGAGVTEGEGGETNDRLQLMESCN